MRETGTLDNIIARWQPKLEDCRDSSPRASIALGPEKLIGLFAMLGLGYAAALILFASEKASSCCCRRCCKGLQ